jgi:hypothetical protein
LSVRQSIQILPNRLNQRLTANFDQNEIYLDLGKIDANLKAESGNQVDVKVNESRSKDICELDSSKMLTLRRPGICEIELSADGNRTYLPFSMKVSLDIKPSRQTLDLNVPKSISLKEKSFSFSVRLSSKLPVKVTTLDSARCKVQNQNGNVTISLIDIGNCRLKFVSQRNLNFENISRKTVVKILPFDTTITCQAGKLAKKVITGFRPKCPAGYKLIR